MNVPTTGLVPPPTAVRSAAACSTPVVATGGTYTTTTASTSSSYIAARTVNASIAGSTATPRSIGRPLATRSPRSRQASTARMPRAVELATIATRSPAGNGWFASSIVRSNAWVRVSTRSTPDWANRVSTALADTSAEDATSPGLTRACRPDFSATTGLRRARARASLANLRGLPNDSSQSSTTSVRGSSYQNCIRSLPDTSALLPAEANEDSPTPRRPPPRARRCRGRRTGRRTPAAPAGHRGASVAFIRTAGVGVDQAQAVRPEHPHAVGPGGGHEFPVTGAAAPPARRRPPPARARRPPWHRRSAPRRPRRCRPPPPDRPARPRRPSRDTTGRPAPRCRPGASGTRAGEAAGQEIAPARRAPTVSGRWTHPVRRPTAATASVRSSELPPVAPGNT